MKYLHSKRNKKHEKDKYKTHDKMFLANILTYNYKINTKVNVNLWIMRQNLKKCSLLSPVLKRMRHLKV